MRDERDEIIDRLESAEAKVEVLLEAMGSIASKKTTEELTAQERAAADFENAWNLTVQLARDALATVNPSRDGE